MMLTLADHDDIVGFFSYSREDDEDSEAALSRLRMRIQNELRAQMGRSRETLRLWQDREAISAGTLWEGEIDRAVQSSSFFIPIVTPRVVRSRYCQIEFQKFLARETELQRNDLIFPILYIGVSALESEKMWRDDPVLRVIGERQYVDWRMFRHEPDSVTVRTAIEKFCRSIVVALERRPKVRAPEPPDPSTDGGTDGDLLPAKPVRRASSAILAGLVSGAGWSPLQSAALFLGVGALSGAISASTGGLLAVQFDKELKIGLVPAIIYSLVLCYSLFHTSKTTSWRMLFVFPIVMIGWVLAVQSAAHLALYVNEAQVFSGHHDANSHITWLELASGGVVGGLIGGSSVILAIILSGLAPLELRTGLYGLAFAAMAGLLLGFGNMTALCVVWQGGLSALIAYRLRLSTSSD